MSDHEDLPQKPLLIYDGDCDFCRRWIASWNRLKDRSIRHAPYQEVADQFPEISQVEFKSSVHLIDEFGQRFSGAEAVFRLLLKTRYRWLYWAYEKVPGFSTVSEFVYGFVARRRSLFSFITRLLLSSGSKESTYYLTGPIFLLALAICYLTAFLSLAVQIEGLVGEQGILPAQSFLDRVEQKFGSPPLWKLPTVFWLGASDKALRLVCYAGAMLALLVPFAVATPWVLFCLWFLYLSCFKIGGVFLGFQWDILLLEAGFLALFFSPWTLLPGRARQVQPPTPVLWLYRWLLFRLMFSSGIVKLKSGDTAWHDLTALQFHFETQPLPSWAGWYAHQLPDWTLSAMVAGVFFVQLVVPLFIFVSRRARFLVFIIFVGFQTLIAVTGNYGFFNLLTVALCLLLLDDSQLKSLMPDSIKRLVSYSAIVQTPESKFQKISVQILTPVILFLTITMLVFQFGDRTKVPDFIKKAFGHMQSFQLVGNYGLFAVMTTTRPEIIIEGSADGKTWRAYSFHWKPGPLDRAPRFVAPHQPRLDWQMWFAALGNYKSNPWILNFMTQLLKGTKQVNGLLEGNPFSNEPPKYIRAVLYRYHFTDWKDKEQTGNWWKRKRLSLYVPSMKLRTRS